MSSRQFIALGTASQVPTRERNHNGYFLAWDREGILFDPGEGTQRQMIFAGVSASQITQICITHFHGDHCLGLAGVLQRISLDRVPHPVKLHYPAYGQRYIDSLKTASIYHNVAQIEECPFEQAGVIEQNKSFSLSTQQLDHSVESWGYRVQEPDGVTMLPQRLAELGVKGPDIGKLRQQGQLQIGERLIKLSEVSEFKRGRSFAFIMDTRECPGAIELAREADLVVCESTYLKTETEDAIANGHLTAEQAAGIAHQAGARRLVLTHFSQRYTSIEGFLQEAQAIHADCVAVCDGDRVSLP